MVAVVAVVGAASNLVSEEWPMVVASGLLLLVCAAVLFLNRLGRTTASRILLVLAPPLVMWLPPLIARSVGAADVVALPYAVLIMSLLPYLLLRPGVEGGLRWLGVLVTGGVLVGIDWSLVQYLEEDARAAMAPLYPGVKLPQILLWAALGAMAAFLEGPDES